VGAADDQGRFPGLRLGVGIRLPDGLQIVSVPDPQDLPAVGLEPLRHVFGKRQAGAAIDGHVVVVVKADQTAQAEMAGQGGRLG
jgi:hypothetical protein